jgi:hypothetical protein
MRKRTRSRTRESIPTSSSLPSLPTDWMSHWAAGSPIFIGETFSCDMDVELLGKANLLSLVLFRFGDRWRLHRTVWRSVVRN